MKVLGKIYEAEAVQFTGAPMALLDRHGKRVKIYHNMRGYFVRRIDDTMIKISIGDWVITEPAFRVLTDEAFKAQFDATPKGANDERSE